MPPGTIFGGYEAYAQCAGRATRPGGAKSLEGDGSETAREAFSRAGSKSVQIGEDRGSARGESRLQGTLGPVRAGGTRRVQRIRWPFHPPRTHGGIPADRDRWVRVREGAQGILDDARTRANDVRELSAAELQALWAIEYTSLEVAHADLGAVDERLNAMGRERWECYHVSEHEQGRVFYFKRRTSNSVAYLTNLLRVGAVAF